MVKKLSSFYKLLNQLENREYLETFISYNIALISAKLKPSITLNIKKDDKKKTYYLWNTYGDGCLDELGLKYIELRETHNSLILFIYDEYLLQRVLGKPKNLSFLTSIGYKEESTLEEIVMKLKDRYRVHNCPHELGVFLGYPIDDVKAFIDCTEEKCLGCGYWKVYNEYHKAKTIFDLYDNVRSQTVDNILIGNIHVKLSSILRHKFERNQGMII
ncbi:DUF3793 family protein [Clostridium sp.]|uniref:DUF3793 family protein n=1 Tax=Clostridium sp. TaxID=1506 RepID=UPI00321625CC